MRKSIGKLFGCMASMACLALSLAGRGMAQPAANNNFVSANLNGAASYTMPTVTTIGGAVTVEGWVYPRSHAAWQRIVDIGNGAANDNVLLAASQSTTGRPIFEIYSGGSIVLSIVSPNTLPLNTWSHVAGVLGSDLSGRLYINGELVASGTATALAPSVTRSSGFLGKSNWSPDALLDGALGEVRIWSVARTQAQVQATMPAGSITGPTTGLLMDYPFGVTGSSALLDISGNNLHLTQVGTVNYSKFMSGSLVTAGFRGSSTVGIAGGSLAITGSDNDYTGTTTVSAGTSFTLGNGGTTGSPGSGGIANFGTVAFNRSNELTVGNLISGTGGVTQSGSGTTILTGANSYTGTTTVSAGTLQVGNGGTAGTLGTGNVANDAALSFNRSDSWTVSQVVSGTGTLRQAGTGTTILTGANTYSGTTTVSAGTLQVGNGGTAGTLGSGAVVNNATLVVNRSDAITLANAMSGLGRLVKQGAQALTLSGAVTSTGGITVQAGTLLFSGSGRLANDAANIITVENGATFSINRHDTFGSHDATVVAPIVVNAGGIFRNEAGWFNVLGPVTLRGGTLHATATHSSGYSFPLKGTVTVDGGATTSTLSGPGIALGGAAVTETTFDVLDGAATDDLLVSSALLNGPANINLQPLASSGLRKTGAGRMTLTANNTYSGATTISAGTLQVGNGGTSGSLGSGNVVNHAALAWNRSDSVTVANAITGTGSVEHRGSGTLTLTGANTYSGTTTVGAGTLSVGSGGASGTLGSGNVSVAGTLLFNTTASLAVNGLVSGAGAVRKAGSGTVVLGNVAHAYSGTTTVEAGTLEVLERVSGSTAPYVVSAGGTLKLGYTTGGGYSNPTFTVHGAGAASQAGLQVMGGKTLNSNSGILLDTAPSTLRAYGTGSATLAGFDVNSAYFLRTTAAASGSVVDTAVGIATGQYGYKVHADPGANTSTGDLILRGPITGSPGLIKVGNGRLVVAGANTYAGVTAINAGTLQVGEGGTTGTLGLGNVSNAGVLVVNRSDAITIPGVISGSGSFIKTGSGTVTLAGANTYSGATTLSAGTIALAGSGSMSGTSGITMANGTTLDVSGRASVLSLASGQALSVSSGNATLKGSIDVGPGRLGLVPGSNGALTVEGGTLTLASSTAIEVTVSGSALAAGSYKLVSKGTGGSVAGTAPSVTIQGAGIASGTQASLAIVSDELLLRVKAPATIALSNLSQRFDGAAKGVTATTTPAGLTVLLTYNGSSSPPSAIGSYPVVATLDSPDYHGSVTGTLVIQKGLATVTLGNLVQPYDGTQRRATATTVPANLNVVFTYEGSSNPPVAVGRYAVVATVNDARYEGSASGRLVIVSGNAGKGPPANPLPPGFLNYQGYLTDASRQPVGATNPIAVRMVFRLFAQASGGVALWAEEQGTVVHQGQFSVVLGEGNPMAMEAWPSLASVFVSTGASRVFLQVTARGLGAGGSDLTVMPRVLLPPVPYAYLSRHSLAAERLLNASSSPVLAVNGQSVGVMQSSPGATLDVSGEIASSGLRSTGNAQVGGVVRASRIAGRGVLPVGGIVAWTGATPPLGWALCDGSVVNGIKTPDLRGRFILGIGHGTGLTPRTLGELGGFENVTLTLAQMPRHSHVADPPAFWSEITGAHRHAYQGAFGPRETAVMQLHRDDPNHLGRVPTSNPTLPAGEHTHVLDLPSQTSMDMGQGLPHANLPPFYVMAFIMRVQ